MPINYFDKVLFFKFFGLLALTILAGYFNVLAFYAVIIGCVLLSLVGGAYSIFAMSFYTIIKYLNPAMFHFPGEFGAIAWVVLILSCVRNVIVMRQSAFKIVIPLLIFTVITGIFAIIGSAHVSVSIMKLISFLIGTCTVFAAFSICNPKEMIYIQHWVLAIYAVLVVFSLLSLAKPEWSYYVNGTGFQGIINHPQAYGAMLSIMFSWLSAQILFGRIKFLSLYSVFAAVILVQIVLSQTRTALVGSLLSIFTLSIIFFINQRRFKPWGSIKKLGTTVASIVVVFAIAFSVIPQVQEVVNGFVFKRKAENLEEAVSSRSGGYGAQLDNFVAKPLYGWGFGVYPGQKATSKDVVTFMGIPISAPVEKGFILTGLLEETGLIGTGLFFYLVISLSRRALLANNVGTVAAFFSCLYINTGEAVFFSVGGIGLFYWIIIGMTANEYKLNAITQTPKARGE